MKEFEVLFYSRTDGTEPAKDFILSLDTKMRAKMLRTIEMLTINGNQLREPYSKPLDDGIFELRAKVGSDISRVLYFFNCREKNNFNKWFCEKNTKDTKSRN